jgi:hypothetical protein
MLRALSTSDSLRSATMRTVACNGGGERCEPARRPCGSVLIIIVVIIIIIVIGVSPGIYVDGRSRVEGPLVHGHDWRPLSAYSTSSNAQSKKAVFDTAGPMCLTTSTDGTLGGRDTFTAPAMVAAVAVANSSSWHGSRYGRVSKMLIEMWHLEVPCVFRSVTPKDLCFKAQLWMGQEHNNQPLGL